MKNVLALILGGGRGTRLHPLTSERSKPAVPLAGKYRLIDIPISNCLNSGVERVFVITQFLAESLNHHIGLSYRFDSFREGFVNILAAEQTGYHSSDWYQGTADAVRKNLRHTDRYRFEEYLILSGDHLYRMDYRKLIEEHRARGADITVAALEVDRSKVPELGVMEIGAQAEIVRFVEKPSEEEVIDTLEIPEAYFQRRNEPHRPGLFLANMGIYVFNRNVMQRMLEDSEDVDFGREVLPKAVASGLKIYAHKFNGYWEDIGTIRAFFDANLELTDQNPKFSFYDEFNQIYTRPRALPGNKIFNSKLNDVLLSEGCIIRGANLSRVLVGIRARIGDGATIRESILMGADFYESSEQRDLNKLNQKISVGIGKGSYLDRVIVDKNARIGAGVCLIGGDAPDQEDKDGGWTLRDGVLVIHKGATIPSNTVIDFSSGKLN